MNIAFRIWNAFTTKLVPPVIPAPRTVIVGHGSTFHDPAIAVIDGDVIFAEAFERHTQCKRSMNAHGLWYSWRPMLQALTELGVLPVEDAEVVFRTSWNLGPVKLSLLNLKLVTRHLLQHRELPPAGGFVPLLRTQDITESVVRLQTEWVLRGVKTKNHLSPDHPKYARGKRRRPLRPRRTPHHVAHAANAVYTSPFDECVVMIVDGAGDAGSLSFFHFVDGEFRALNQGAPFNSLGFLYSYVTELCGFDPWDGEEWKVMGLAGYGSFREEIYEFFMSKTKIKGLDLKIELDATKPDWAKPLEAIVGSFRNERDPDVLKAADLAFSFQKYFTDVVCTLADNASRLGLSKNLAYAGGCALNSATNGEILSRSGFARLHIPSAPGDDGNALGVALYEKHFIRKQVRRLEVMSPYSGSSIDGEDLRRVLAFDGIRHVEFDDEATLCAEVAKRLADGKIIGWMQGRAEFGPRALGNRSILADPRSQHMKEEINRRVKFREEYRPLAPSILHEFGPEYFEDYQESPYMDRTLAFRPEVRGRVPAVVHVDGTGRLQSVKAEWNPLFHRLIRAFHARTGVPILLNTSFNVMGKPIVHSVTDAIAVFFSTDLDYLVIGKVLLTKRRE
jgi:carbamoyltransferase